MRPAFIHTLFCLLLPCLLIAQKRNVKPVKESLIISCILNDAKEPAPEKEAFDMGTEELKLVLQSATDTVVKASMDGVVSTIQREPEGTYELVYYHNDYWFWLSGLTKVTVSKNAKIKNGQPIGIIEAGKKIELLLFDFETPADPKKYLNCPSFQPLK